jgi:hypothetical protein
MQRVPIIAASLLIAVTLFTIAPPAGGQGDPPVPPGDIFVDLQEHHMSAEEVRSHSEKIQSLEIVSLANFSGAKLQRLQALLNNTEDNFAEIRTAIQANERFQAALRENGVEIFHVTAATRPAPGIINIYTDLPDPKP